MTSEYFYPHLRNDFWIFLSAVLVVPDIFIRNRHLTCGYFFFQNVVVVLRILIFVLVLGSLGYLASMEFFICCFILYVL